MPELPEVQTTVNGLTRTIVGLRIVNAWTDYNSIHGHKRSIKDPNNFQEFKRIIVGKKVLKVERRAKNILIYLNNSKDNDFLIVLVHMRMTGHLLYGSYKYSEKDKSHWTAISPKTLLDPFNRHIHFVLSFSNGKYLALSDSRKFAEIILIKDKEEGASHFANTGPEPLQKDFTLKLFEERIMTRPKGKIKQVLMDQKIIAGIGNIYADETLWLSGIHPLIKVKDISKANIRKLYHSIKCLLQRGIDLGGDSMSDYRNIYGEKGSFQEKHHAYKKTGKPCEKKGCRGTIVRISLGGRGTHFCNKHQLLKK